jgi:hypothetical protein
MENERNGLYEVYGLLFETWRFQVDSYWQRSSYFAAFETAAIAGCWELLKHKDLWAACTLSVLGFLLTMIWLYNNYKTHKYVSHWWNSLCETEAKLGLRDNDMDFVSQQKGGGLMPYRHVVQAVPLIFSLAWLILFVRTLLVSCAC